MPRGLSSLSILCLLLSGACRSDGQRQDVVVRDSAGVVIVENARAVRRGADSWRIADSPAVEIGVSQGDAAYELSDVVGAVRLRDGTLVIANGGSAELRYYDSDGRLLGIAGGPGDGPGEFDRFGGMSAIWPERGDSVGVWDARNARLSIFDSQGQFIRTVTLDHQAFATDVVARFSDGGFLVETRTSCSETRQWIPCRGSIQLARFAADGTRVFDYGGFPGYESMVAELQGNLIAARPPFARLPAVTILDSMIYYGSTDGFEIEVITPRGVPVRLIRRTDVDLRLSQREIDIHKESRVSEADEASRPEMRRVVDLEPYRDALPAYRQFVSDPTGNVWVRGYPRPGVEENLWSVFDDEGRWTTDVQMPIGLRVLEIGQDYMIALRRDSLDVEHVGIYMLVRPG